MKLAIYSDLHLEFGKFEPPALDVDVVVLAGDIGKRHYGLRWAAQAFPTQQIIYVAGNHEFYGERRDMVLSNLRKEAQKESRLHFLDNSEVVLDGVRFLGATLWTDFSLFGAASQSFAMDAASRMMSDYRLIKRGKSDDTGLKNLLTPEDTLRSHEYSVRWLGNQLDVEFAGATVVVTHHAPSIKSLNKYDREKLSSAYASNLEHLVDKTTLWIHGHTHESVNYLVGRGGVVSNPRGYAGAGENEFFEEALVIDIPDRQFL